MLASSLIGSISLPDRGNWSSYTGDWPRREVVGKGKGGSTLGSEEEGTCSPRPMVESGRVGLAKGGAAACATYCMGDMD